MMIFTKIVLSTLMALTLTKRTEGLDRTHQIRHPHDDRTSERQLSPLTALTEIFLERVQCRKKLRACQKLTNGETPPLDEWEARISSLSGGNSTNLLVQALQDAIASAQSVDMTAIINALKKPAGNAADKKALMQEARTIKAEAQALWKAASTSSFEEVSELIEKMQTVLIATSNLVQNVFGKMLEMFFKAIVDLVKLFFSCAKTLCCGDDPQNLIKDCKPICVLVAALPLSPFIILYGLVAITVVTTWFIIFLLWFIFIYDGSIPVRMATNIGGTCSDKLLSCHYDSLLLAIMPTAIDLADKL